MAGRRSFKADESFLKFISMGAIGARQVFEDLAKQGHEPMELERGSQSFKIWKTIKIKRIRVPDIFCAKCGMRVESRAKTRLDISMSHSRTDPERAWDFELDDDDYVALVAVTHEGDRPIDWKADVLVQYVLVKDLRKAQEDGNALLIRPKGAQEGFETRIIWPSAVANFPGTVIEIAGQRLKYRREEDERTISLLLRRMGIDLKPLVAAKAPVRTNQIVASVVPVTREIACEGGLSTDHLLEGLTSASRSERYTSAKALSRFPSGRVVEALRGRVLDKKEDVLVRLEAAASLARAGDKDGVDFIRTSLQNEQHPNRLEAVIVLGEIGGDEGTELLVGVLWDDGQPAEIRAGAAWALGELRDRSSIDALVKTFSNVDEMIRIEAARALAKIAREHRKEVMGEFPVADDALRPGIAWAISKAGSFTLEEIQETFVDDDTRHWGAYILGSQDDESFIAEIEKLKGQDPEVYFAATVLWKIMRSWVFGMEEYG